MIKLLIRIGIIFFMIFCSCSVKKHELKYYKIEGLIIYKVIDYCEIKVYLLYENQIYDVNQEPFYRFKDYSGSYDMSKDLDIDDNISYNIKSNFLKEIGNDNVFINKQSENTFYIPIMFQGYVSIIDYGKLNDKELFFEKKLKGTVNINKIISTNKIYNINDYFDLQKSTKKTVRILCNDIIIE